jgi:hypothetical protein
VVEGVDPAAAESISAVRSPLWPAAQRRKSTSIGAFRPRSRSTEGKAAGGEACARFPASGKRIPESGGFA